jgi:multidrug efflux system outer membrane protein
MNRAFKTLLPLATLLAIAGCKVGPNYKRPVVATPADYRGELAPDIAATPAANATTVPLGAEKYNDVFTDPVLQQLIAEALKNNYDVKIAADRVLEEQAAVGVTRAGEFPTVSFGGSYDALGLPSSLLNKLGGSNNNSNNNGSTSSSNSTSNNAFSGGLTASVAWNLDFWGQYRRQTEAARAEYRATLWAQQTTYSTLVEEVATDYYQLRALDAQLAVTQQTLATRQQSLDLTRTLEQGGAGTLADVRQAEELFYTAQAQLPSLEQQIEQAENNLSILLGRNPGSILRDVTASPQILANAPHPVDVPVGLPSQLLERRPDIRRAEELLVQANANIGVAKAAFFPALSITGTSGVTSSQLKGLIDSGNVYYYAVGSLTQPIFDAGKNKNNLREAQAKDQELIDTYRQTIAGALRDVSNALVAYNRTREYREQQEKLVAASADAVRLAKMRFHAGATSYLEVLTNDATLYSAQLSLAAAEQQQALALVQLYNALGGGW